MQKTSVSLIAHYTNTKVTHKQPVTKRIPSGCPMYDLPVVIDERFHAFPVICNELGSKPRDKIQYQLTWLIISMAGREGIH
jgi:hypothetical protein